MNFRSFARAVLDALDFRKKPGDGESAPAPKRERRAPVFGRSSGGDGFEAGGRGTPVDLTGGVKRRYEVTEELVPPPAPPPTDFVASLDDLGALMETVDQALPDPEGFELQPYGPEPRDTFESVAAPSDEPIDSFEPAPPMEDGPIDSFEPAPHMAASPPAAEVAAEPVAVEQPVAAPAPQPAAPKPAAAAPQHTVALLMPIARELPPRAEVAEQFSTLELFDMVARLTGAEEPAPVANPPAVEAITEAAPTTVPPSGAQRLAVSPMAPGAPNVEPAAIEPAVVASGVIDVPATVAAKPTAERALTTEPLEQPAAGAGVAEEHAATARVGAPAVVAVTPGEERAPEPVVAPVAVTAEVPAPPSQAAATPAAVVEPAPMSVAGPTQPHFATAPATAEPAPTTIQSPAQPVAAEQPAVAKVTPAGDAGADPTPK